MNSARILLTQWDDAAALKHASHASNSLEIIMDSFLEFLFNTRQAVLNMDMCVERRIKLSQLDKIIYEYKMYLVIQENKKDNQS